MENDRIFLFYVLIISKYIFTFEYMVELIQKIEEKGLKKSWIAKKLGISQTLLSFYLTGTRVIPEEREKELKELLS